MSSQLKQIIVTKSEWVLIPFLTLFCLATLGNVTQHWEIISSIVFAGQSCVIACTLFTFAHVALFLEAIKIDELWPRDPNSDEAGCLMGVIIIPSVAAIVAIPVSFFVGWVLFALAFGLLLYHVAVSITLMFATETKEPASITQMAATEQSIVEIPQSEGQAQS